MSVFLNIKCLILVYIFFISKHRYLPVITSKQKAKAVKSFIREESNVKILQNPYITEVGVFIGYLFCFSRETFMYIKFHLSFSSYKLEWLFRNIVCMYLCGVNTCTCICKFSHYLPRINLLSRQIPDTVTHVPIKKKSI